jgi:CelD/BcsL family acetyltransferase involved in cellulose biosynthesis
VRWVVISTPYRSELSVLIADIVAVHDRRSRQLRAEAPLADSASRLHFETILQAPADQGVLRLFVYELGGRIGAYAATVNNRDAVWVYSNMAEPDLLRYSPGAVVNSEIVRFAHEFSLAVDWGVGVQRSTASGGAELRPTVNLSLVMPESARD